MRLHPNDEDIEVSDVRPPSKGGQHVGIPHPHIKVLHKPTGIYAVVSYEKSQHRCRNIALAMVEYGLAEMGWIK
jgi:protein subunit release factor A